ncbi:MAG: hypothetical protein KAW17_09000 [Candidatus Eisenbacteria sp.]|nr:hypothetical protein [Candidatus Eisenbacteria bacterium]
MLALSSTTITRVSPRGRETVEARSRPRTRPLVQCEGSRLVEGTLIDRIGGLVREMDAALANGEYDRVVRLAEEQEKLLEALMS